jgi:hypothetical protein
MPATPSLAELRQLLAARFPSASPRESPALPTGIPALDNPDAGGLSAGAFTELVCEGSGGGLVLAALLAATRRARQRLALLDAADTFAPDDFPADLLEHLVWARGAGADLKPFWAAADLLLRDSHFAVVVLDLRGVPERELLRTPGPLWYRLQRALEQSGVAALVLSPLPASPCARRRFRLTGGLHAPALHTARATLCAELAAHPELRRGAFEERTA